MELGRCAHYRSRRCAVDFCSRWPKSYSDMATAGQKKAPRGLEPGSILGGGGFERQLRSLLLVKPSLSGSGRRPSGPLWPAVLSCSSVPTVHAHAKMATAEAKGTHGCLALRTGMVVSVAVLLKLIGPGFPSVRL